MKNCLWENGFQGSYDQLTHLWNNIEWTDLQKQEKMDTPDTFGPPQITSRQPQTEIDEIEEGTCAENSYDSAVHSVWSFGTCAAESLPQIDIPKEFNTQANQLYAPSTIKPKNPAATTNNLKQNNINLKNWKNKCAISNKWCAILKPI